MDRHSPDGRSGRSPDTGGPAQAAGAELWAPVLALLAQGRTDQQISAHLGIGLRTVRRRVAEAMEQFGVRSRFELGAAWAARQRDVPTPTQAGGPPLVLPSATD